MNSPQQPLSLHPARRLSSPEELTERFPDLEGSAEDAAALFAALEPRRSVAAKAMALDSLAPDVDRPEGERLAANSNGEPASAPPSPAASMAPVDGSSDAAAPEHETAADGSVDPALAATVSASRDAAEPLPATDEAKPTDDVAEAAAADEDDGEHVEAVAADDEHVEEDLHGPDVFAAEDSSADAAFSSETEGAWFDRGHDANEEPRFDSANPDDEGRTTDIDVNESGVVLLPNAPSEAAEQPPRERSIPAPRAEERAASLRPAAHVEASPKRWPLTLLVGVVLLVNIALASAMVTLRAEAHKSREPVAALSTDVKELHDQQKDLHEQQDENRAQINETKSRLDKQAAELAKTAQSVAAAVRRQDEAEREAKELAAREARDVAALTARMGRVERTVEDSVYTVEEAVKIIDMAQHRSTPSLHIPSSPADSAPLPAEGEAKPASRASRSSSGAKRAGSHGASSHAPAAAAHP